MVKGKRSVAVGSWVFCGCISKMRVIPALLLDLRLKKIAMTPSYYQFLFSDSFAEQILLLFLDLSVPWFLPPPPNTSQFNNPFLLTFDQEKDSVSPCLFLRNPKVFNCEILLLFVFSSNFIRQKSLRIRFSSILLHFIVIMLENYSQNNSVISLLVLEILTFYITTKKCVRIPPSLCCVFLLLVQKLCQ